MSGYKMPTKKSYVGNDLGSKVARFILDTKRNFRKMGSVNRVKNFGMKKANAPTLYTQFDYNYSGPKSSNKGGK
jgi:hypothetical protein